MAYSSRTNRSRIQILGAADASFREKGFPNVSMEEIAQRAGLTRKTVYNLFSSKEEIAFQLIAQVEAGDAIYRSRMQANDDVLVLLEDVFLHSAQWCMANPSLARLGLAPAKPSLEPPVGRPSFQGLVRDLLVLGQRQGVIRKDDDPNFMSLILLGFYAQSMLAAFAGGPFSEDGVRHLIRIVVEGIGEPSSSLERTRPRNARRPADRSRQ
ncbi:TetR/AcrR family transcriptional regulator [Bradyrhizobium liaoningense]|uniref:TetR/AcrR family transcriptional regulator n=1 Tax=Bradyrhizobium liaoningense TaxID=43992 RepID=UPI001BA6BEA1|nr:TetR/AcrR family transcriptional regulator [Bradyrhizobium liaoningense]MBR0859156.1 TetR/AcrR family transcriptional regulator [Bradyrhizobium liaoningense]